MKTEPTPVQLKPVHGSEYCQYSVIENKLKVLYENQVVIYNKLNDIEKLIQRKTHPEFYI